MAPQAATKKATTSKFTIDATIPANDKIFDVYDSIKPAFANT